MSQNRILVGVDFSASSDRATVEARRLARQMGGAQLDFAYVCPVPVAAPELPVDSTYFDDAKKLLAQIAEAARADGFAAETHLAVGDAVYGLCDFIDKLEPTLVVVGSHGRGAVMRLILGSVAEGLVRRSTVPVVVVPAPAPIVSVASSAASCRDCGHIRAKHEATGSCKQCGADPAQWTTAEITADPIDAGLPSVGEEARYEVSGSAPAGLFATSPGGVEGLDVNPELRVRY